MGRSRRKTVRHCFPFGADNSPRRRCRRAKQLTQTPKSDCILVGRFGAPFGVRGWLRIIRFGGDSFLRIKEWRCAPRTCDLSARSWRAMRVENIRPLRGGFAAKLAGIEQREDAAKWTHGGIAVSRESLPPLAKGEYYWRDLVGLRALDANGELLGEVCGLFRTGAHDVLRIVPADGGAEILTPFVDEYVIATDFSAGEIQLHWRREW